MIFYFIELEEMNSSIVCYTCGETLGNKYKLFSQKLREKHNKNPEIPYTPGYHTIGSSVAKSNEDICNELGITCQRCRIQLITSLNVS